MTDQKKIAELEQKLTQLDKEYGDLGAYKEYGQVIKDLLGVIKEKKPEKSFFQKKNKDLVKSYNQSKSQFDYCQRIRCEFACSVAELRNPDLSFFGTDSLLIDKKTIHQIRLEIRESENEYINQVKSQIEDYKKNPSDYIFDYNLLKFDDSRNRILDINYYQGSSEKFFKELDKLEKGDYICNTLFDGLK
jgi:hypothetical protein